MKSALALAAALFGTLAAAPAFAQEGATPVAAAAVEAAAATPSKAFCFQIEMLPVGTLDLGREDGLSVDTAKAFAIGLTMDYDVLPYLSVGAAPRLVMGLRGEDGFKEAKQLDVRARATAHVHLLPALQAYASLAPGYSVMLIPDDARLENPRGFVLALAGGFSLDLSADSFLTAELGYQLGFQTARFDGAKVDLSSNLLHIGLGGGLRF